MNYNFEKLNTKIPARYVNYYLCLLDFYNLERMTHQLI